MRTIPMLGSQDRDRDEEGLVQPTPEEAKNGWTAKTLTEYVNTRINEQNALIEMQERELPSRANSNYNPLEW